MFLDAELEKTLERQWRTREARKRLALASERLQAAGWQVLSSKTPDNNPDKAVRHD